RGTPQPRPPAPRRPTAGSPTGSSRPSALLGGRILPPRWPPGPRRGGRRPTRWRLSTPAGFRSGSGRAGRRRARGRSGSTGARRSGSRARRRGPRGWARVGPSASTGNVWRVHAGQEHRWLRPPPRRSSSYASSSILATGAPASPCTSPTLPAEALVGSQPQDDLAPRVAGGQLVVGVAHLLEWIDRLDGNGERAGGDERGQLLPHRGRVGLRLSV